MYLYISMEMSLVTLSEYLSHTLSPDDSIRRPAELTLESLQTQSGYSILLLTLLQESSVLSHTSHSAAIAFKNFVKKYWDLEGETNPLSPQDRIVSYSFSFFVTSNQGLRNIDNVWKYTYQLYSILLNLCTCHSNIQTPK